MHWRHTHARIAAGVTCTWHTPAVSLADTHQQPHCSDQMVAWSGDKTTAFAESPLGQHTTPAAVCCVLYFAATCASVFSLVWTRYPAYFALSVSCALRTVAFGVKAAMLEVCLLGCAAQHAAGG